MTTVAMTDVSQITRRSFLGRAVATGAAAAAAPRFLTELAQAAGTGNAQGWQIGIYTRPWASFDYRVAFDAMVEAGFQYAGLMTTTNPSSKGRQVISTETTPEEAAQVAEELKKRKLQAISVYGGGLPVQKSLEEGIAGMRKLIDHCATVGAKSLLMGGTSEKFEEPYYKAIAECCGYAAEKGIMVTLKPHGPITLNGALCRERVEKVGKPNFRVCYDPGNVYFYSDGQTDPVQDATTVDGLVTAMCVKDYLDPTDQQKKRVDVTPGTGKVKWLALMARLKQGGFNSGPLVIECLSPGDPAATIAEAKKAREFVEKLVGANASTAPAATQPGGGRRKRRS